MRVELTDVYGQTIILHNVLSVFMSIVEDDILCVKIFGENKERRYNLKTLNYWGVTEQCSHE